MSLETIPTLPTILDIWENNIDTNINILDISNLINLLDTLSTTEIKIKMLPGNLTPTGDWVPDNARVEQEIMICSLQFQKIPPRTLKNNHK